MKIHEEWAVALESRFGKISFIHEIACEEKSKPKIYVFFFENLPENLLTAITFGLSNAEMNEWKYGSPELIVTLDTKDKAWGLSAGYFASSFFNEKLFTFGSLYSSNSPLTTESEMSGFFVYESSFLEPEQATFQLSDRIVHLSGMYPIYKEEEPLLIDIGVENFTNLEDYDMYNPKRKMVTNKAN